MNTQTTPMLVNRYSVGDRVKSRTGWTGTVTKVLTNQGKRRYRVRWDNNGYESQTGMSPLELFPA